jgi:hypothetical protein
MRPDWVDPHSHFPISRQYKLYIPKRADMFFVQFLILRLNIVLSKAVKQVRVSQRKVSLVITYPSTFTFI